MTTSYISNALAFELPVTRAAVADRTIHELVVPGADGNCDVGLAISRQRLTASLAEAVDQLHDEERRFLGGFELKRLAGRSAGGVDWLDTQVSWKHPSGAVYHRRLHCQLGSLWMSITTTAQLSNAAWADRVAEQVVTTFRPRPEENA